MNIEDITKLKPNQRVHYGGFNDLVFKGADAKHVYLEDKYGNTKKIYIKLFKKYGAICTN